MFAQQQSRKTGRQSAPGRMRGSVLLWGLVILLVLTIMGVAATRMAGTDTRIAGNQLLYMMTFQGAESTLVRTTTLFNVVDTATNGTYSDTEEAKVKTFGPFTDAISGGQLSSTGEMAMKSEGACPPVRGMAMSYEMTPETGKVACRIFTVDAKTRLQGTGTRTEHLQGVLKYVPPQGG